METEYRRRSETAEEVLFEVKTQLQNKQLEVAELKRQLESVISDLSRADNERRRLQEKVSSRVVTYSEEFQAIPCKEDVKAENKKALQREAEKTAAPKTGGAKPTILPTKPKAGSRPAAIMPAKDVKGSVARSIPTLSRWKDSFLRWLGARRTAVRPTAGSIECKQAESQSNPEGDPQGPTRGSQTPTPVKRMPKKPAAEPEEGDEQAKETDPSIWRKRKGTQAKARPVKKKKTAEAEFQPTATRSPVTLLPRVHQEYQAPMDDEVRPSDSISQVGEGPYEKASRVRRRQEQDS